MTNQQPPVAFWRRVLGSWQLPVAVTLALLVALALWLAPRRSERVVSVDERHAWNADHAPARRQFVWEPAVPAEAAQTAAKADLPELAGASLIRPQLTDGGATFYFTLRRADGAADIYRARLVDGRWRPPQPVAAFNSPADDIGPVLTADGGEAYLYSNRPGGHGGFDLYVSRRTDEGWSEPENLGPPVNTPAHEYDPAVSPDGNVLVFASNHTPQMQARLPAGGADAESEAAAKDWSATLRAHPGLPQFDLYVARRGDAGEAWSGVEPLAEINRADANEGAPAVSPNGVYLYFASDRAGGSGPPRNYDLYRAQLRGGHVGEAENLGPSVNTAANETEPALSPEGFTLLFSSDREGGDGESYALYRSRALEVTEETAWDTTNWQAFISVWPWTLALLLLLVLLVLLYRATRNWLFRRASAARFVLASLLLHMLLAAVAGVVTVGRAILREREEIIQVASSQILEDQHQSHQAGQEAYEKTGDLKTVDQIDVPQVVRQIETSPNVPQPHESLAPALPAELARRLPDRRVLRVPRPAEPQPEVQPREAPQLSRRRPTLPQQVAPVPAAAEELPAEAVAVERPLEPPVDVARQAATSTPPPRAVAAPQTPALPRAARLNNLAHAAPAEPPAAPDNATALPARAAAAAAAAVPAAEDAPTLAAAPAPAESGPAPQVGVTRQVAASSAPDAPQVDAPLPLRPADAATTAQRAEGPVLRSTPRHEQTRLPRTAPQLAKFQPAAEADSNAPEVAAVDAPSLTAIAAAAAVPRRAAELAPPEPDAFAATRPGEALPLNARTPASVPRDVQLPDPRPAAPARRPAELRVAAATGPAAEEDAMLTPAGAADSAPALEVAANVARRADAQPAPRTSGIQAALPRPAAANHDLSPARSAAAADLSRRRTAELAKAARPGAAPAALPAEPGAALRLESAVPPAEAALDRPVELARSEPAGFTAPVPTPEQPGGPRNPRDPRVVVGSLAREPLDAPPALHPLASRLARRPAKAKRVAYAEDSVGVQQMFSLREGEVRQQFIELFGGSVQTETAVERGLQWLAAQQAEDGRWSLHQFPGLPKGTGNAGAGRTQSDTAATGFALLPFLGTGQTHRQGKYQQQVAAGIGWLVDHQKDDGDLFTGGGGNAHMYSHGVAAIALCEAYGMSRDPELKKPAQKALEFIVAAQHKAGGGWRYKPGQPGDTSVVGWQLMALKSGEMAGLDVPEQTLALAGKWLDSVEGQGNQRGRFGYTGRGGSAAMTAEGLLCRQFLGARRNDPSIRLGADFLGGRLPKQGQETSYYWYYATQVMYHMQGEYWQKWNGAARDLLVNTQQTSGPLAGTWHPRDSYEQQGGRLYATSLRLLMLEVYYRHLPLYRQLAE